MAIEQKENTGPWASAARLEIHRADIAGFPPVWRWSLQIVLLLLVIASLAFSILLLPIAAYVFWVFLATSAQIQGLPTGHGWPVNAALALGVLTASGTAYLLQDAVLHFANDRASRLLREKAEHLRGAPLPENSFFVQIETVGAWPQGNFPPKDVGWLTVDETRLDFTGDHYRISLPRDSARSIRQGSQWLRLVSTARLEMVVDTGLRGKSRLRIIPRDNDRVEDSAAALKRLEGALTAWRDA